MKIVINISDDANVSNVSLPESDNVTSVDTLPTPTYDALDGGSYSTNTDDMPNEEATEILPPPVESALNGGSA